MESQQRLEAKGKILVDALVMCLSRSKVREVVDPETIRSVIGSALGELWREGEFRLEPVWKILCQQPGLSAQAVAPPMFVFKSHEEQLGVAVRLPQALAAVPRAEQVKLRDALGIKSEEFAQYLRELAALATSEQAKRGDANKPARAEPSKPAPEPRRDQYALPKTGPMKKASPRSRGLIAALLGAAAIAAIGFALYSSLSSSAAAFDTADVASILQLERGLRKGEGITAHIRDPRWEALGKDEQKRLAGEVFERELQKGIKVMTLQDGAGRVRVIASDVPGNRQVIVR
ncbi:MAG TPA: hypothetical protein VFF06_04185 [Polyangia bacterium]|nr:hypothetical protein [Polyangia bacterium]